MLVSTEYCFNLVLLGFISIVIHVFILTLVTTETVFVFVLINKAYFCHCSHLSIPCSRIIVGIMFSC